MSTDTKASQSAAWQRVREAISERWPNVNRDELAECENDAGQLVQFVKQRVQASNDEIEAVVHEFMPQESITERVTQVASERLQDAAESAQFAYMRADEYLAKRPTESVLTGFLAGIALGATVTALLMSSRPQPSAWDRVKQRTWI